jgi:hypothetical protein
LTGPSVSSDPLTPVEDIGIIYGSLASCRPERMFISLSREQREDPVWDPKPSTLRQAFPSVRALMP